MRACFIAAIFVSAALLFTVQPFTGKLLLPLAGGSPQVWNTCMVFFQAMLLAGYLYAHGITRLPIRFQGPVHLCVLAIAALMLPVDVAGVAKSQAPDASAPTAWLLGLLITTVGLPFFAVSTTSPLLQSWFARTRDARAKDPYFLYVASNAGSVVGLLAYPLLIEPIMTRQAQAMSWTGGYGLFFLLIAGCMALVLAAARGARAPEGASTTDATESGATGATGAAPLDARPITWSRRFFWLGLALIPSSLMLGVTQYISTDLAAVPLLWVAPLLLYLVSFMVAFSNVVPVSAKWLGRVTPMVVAVMAVVLLTQARDPVIVIVLVHVLGFFVLAWMCHRRLAEDRPDPRHLTEFYLLMSVGGVLGGIFNALIAPTVFNVVLEYPLAIAAACFMTPQFSKDWRGAWSGGVRSRGVLLGSIVLGGVVVFSAVIVASRMIARGELDGFTRQAIALGGVPVTLSLLLLLVRGTPRFAVAIMLAMLVAPFLGTLQDLYVKRTFFGVHRVQRQVEGGMGLHRLLHGTTLHGVQFRTDLVAQDGAAGMGTPFGGPKLAPETRNGFLFERAAWDELARLARRGRYQLLPTSYYHPKGPMGDVMQMLINANKLDQVALIGMGAGTLAAYAQPGTTMVFYEIDPAVNDIAHNQAFYTFISDAVRDPTVRIGTILGDGRKMIEVEQPGVGPFRLIVVDAFSSDAIPVHLITKEAVEAYLKRTTPDGLIAFHISNRYFDLSPVTARIAKELGLVAFIRNDTIEDPEEQKRDSLWVVLARDRAHLGELATRNAMWTQMSADDSDPLWTDDYSNVLGVFVPLRDVLGRQK